MKKYSGSSTCGRKCVACSKKTGNYIVWCYADGIEIDVPVCHRCRDKISWCIDTSMKIHLKGIMESIRKSIIISLNEKRIADQNQELKQMKGGGVHEHR